MARPFLDLPDRSAKPREQGITHVLDRGLSVAEVDGLIEVAGDAVDIVKLGWGTALATGNLERQARPLPRARDPGRAGRHADRARDRPGPGRRPAIAWLRELELEHVEVSDGTIALDHGDKLALIERLAAEFTVFSEVGSKDAAKIMAPYRWVEQIRGRARGRRAGR